MFNSIDNVFLIQTCNVFLKNLALEKICMLDKKALENQESWIVNGHTTAKYFELGRGTCHKDLISAYLSIFVMEVAFIFKKVNNNIDGHTIFRNNILCAAETSFFLKNLNRGFKNFLWIFLSSGLKTNRSNYNIAGPGAPQRVRLALCDVNCISLNNGCI